MMYVYSKYSSIDHCVIVELFLQSMHNLTNKTMDELKIVPFTMIHSC